MTLVTFQKTSGASTDELAGVSDYLLRYARDRTRVKHRQLLLPKSTETFVPTAYSRIEESSGVRRAATKEERQGSLASGDKLYALGDLTSQRPAQGNDVRDFEFKGRTFTPGAGTFKTDAGGLRRLAWAGRLEATANRLGFVRFLDDFPAYPLTNLWTDAVSSFMADKVYVVQTTTKVIERCVLMSTDPGDIVLDPTLGGGTSAVVAEQWGRRWIGIDTSRVALALSRTRLMAARFPYFILADSTEGLRRMSLDSGTPMTTVGGTNDIRKGFLYQRVPHVTLASIAQNPEIVEGMTRDDIDAAIVRHSQTEVLHDRPYADPRVVRVAGPFTVESLSPHRLVAEGEEGQSGAAAAPVTDSARFVDMVLDNLRKAGVQNQIKEQRLDFHALDRFSGRAIQADGTYNESGAIKRAAVAIGPEYGTVGKELVREAAKEAADWADLLIVCGYAFDARAEEMSAIGRLPVVYARMNADLLLGDQLKKTGAGNLFTVFGQPDVDIRTLDDGLLQVDIRGIDVYDPTAGEIRSDAPDMIASWFIDTDYNGESFFVRHAYFCGSDRPYERLSKTLKADIDPEAWETLYSATSRPFPRPESGKIAVKVINHYGDEILKVYAV